MGSDVCARKRQLVAKKRHRVIRSLVVLAEAPSAQGTAGDPPLPPRHLSKFHALLKERRESINPKSPKSGSVVGLLGVATLVERSPLQLFH